MLGAAGPRAQRLRRIARPVRAGRHHRCRRRTVIDETGKPVEGAQIKVVNRSSGFSASGFSRVNGYYLVSNLESGGSVHVTVKRIGYVAADRTTSSFRSRRRRASTSSCRGKRSPSARSRSSPRATPRFSARRVRGEHAGVRLTHHPHAAAESEHHRHGEADAAGHHTVFGRCERRGMYNRLNNFTVDGASRMTASISNSSGGIPGGAGNGRIISKTPSRNSRSCCLRRMFVRRNFTGMLFNA